MFVLIIPGQKSSFVTLHAALEEWHNHLSARTAAEIERRKAGGIPLDDGAGPLTPLGPFVGVAGYDDVRVRFVALSEKRRAALMADIDIAQAARAAFAGKAIVDVAKDIVAADAAVEDAQVSFIRAAIDELHTSDGKVDLSSEVIVEGIKATGALLAHLFIVARDFQGLSPGKEKRFGQHLPSTT